MVISYASAPDITDLVREVVTRLRLEHVNLERVVCCRSHGSTARRTIARIHGMPRIWQEAMKIQPLYIIEVISERFDKMSLEDREKVVIHELMHVPYRFGGGLRGHRGWIDRRKVEALHKALQKSRLE
jgi:predicted metallopeptidase